MLIFSSTLAWAYVICQGAVVTASEPRAGAGAVPLDADLAVGVLGGFDPCANQEVPVSIELLDALGAALATHHETLSLGADAAGIVRWNLDDDLLTNESYTMRVTLDRGTQVEIPFSTGAGRVSPIVGEPSVALTSWSWRKGVTAAVVDLAPVADPDGVSMLRLEQDGRTLAIADAEAASGELRWPEAKRPSEVCLVATQLDGAGVESAGSEPVCVAHGCATTGPISGAGLAALVALLVRRRGTAITPPMSALVQPSGFGRPLQGRTG